MERTNAAADTRTSFVAAAATSAAGVTAGSLGAARAEAFLRGFRLARRLSSARATVAAAAAVDLGCRDDRLKLGFDDTAGASLREDSCSTFGDALLGAVAIANPAAAVEACWAAVADHDPSRSNAAKSMRHYHIQYVPVRAHACVCACATHLLCQAQGGGLNVRPTHEQTLRVVRLTLQLRTEIVARAALGGLQVTNGLGQFLDVALQRRHGVSTGARAHVETRPRRTSLAANAASVCFWRTRAASSCPTADFSRFFSSSLERLA